MNPRLAFVVVLLLTGCAAKSQPHVWQGDPQKLTAARSACAKEAFPGGMVPARLALSRTLCDGAERYPDYVDCMKKYGYVCGEKGD